MHDVSTGCYLCGGKRQAVELGGLAYWECSACGLIMRRDTRVDESLIAQTYGPGYYANPESYPQWDTDPHLRAVLQKRVRALAALRPLRGRLLDVGCGLGHFLRAAGQDGWDIFGIEPAEYRAAMARGNTGASIYPDLDSVQRDRSEPFACVTLWDVLEHDGDPLRLLQRVGGLLQPSGLLAVSMPNRGGLEARLRGSSWRFFRPEFGHMTHHTPDTLRRLLQQAGFWVVAVQTEGSLNVADRLAPILPSRVAAVLQQGLDEVVGRLGRGRTMTLYAIRPAAPPRLSTTQDLVESGQET